jgi:D-alanyl-D-alanine carboxypeptidase (penicillin-binding protein 5/6)
MRKHYEQFVFLAVIVAGIFLARFIYPNISGVPQFANADADQSQQTTTAQQAVTAPPALVLPQTSIAATAQSDGTSVIQAPGTTPLPTFTNEAYLVANLATGNVVAGSNAASRWPTASITKLMTATLVLDQLSPTTTTTITITPQMFSADPDEYTLKIGGTYTVEDLLHVMLMPSSNVAAQAFADTIGQAQFMNEMNARAEQWGMTDTYFADPSGISAANESSANDLMTLAQHIYESYPQILALTNTPVTEITELNSGKKFTVRSINNFAGTPGFVGGKTGNTPQAAANLLSIFNDNGTPVIVIVLGAPSLPFIDTSELYSWYKVNYK